MLLFLDTEFTGLTKDTQLLSIAIVDENNRQFYAEISDYNPELISDWIQENVIDNFFLKNSPEKSEQKTYIKGSYQRVQAELVDWFGFYKNSKCKIVADVPMYDWVLFADIFGGALNLPEYIDFMPLDFASILYIKGMDPHKPRVDFLDSGSLEQIKAEFPPLRQHNALFDTLLLQKCFRLLNFQIE